MLFRLLNADIDIAGRAGDLTGAAGGSLRYIFPAGGSVGDENFGRAQGAPDVAGGGGDLQGFCVAGGQAAIKCTVMSIMSEKSGKSSTLS